MDRESEELYSHKVFVNQTRRNWIQIPNKRKSWSQLFAVNTWHKCILNVCLNSFSDDPLWKSHEASPVTPCRSKDTGFRPAASHLECLCWSPLCGAGEFERSGSNRVQNHDILTLPNYLSTFCIFSGIICLQLIRKYFVIMREWFNWEIILCI